MISKQQYQALIDSDAYGEASHLEARIDKAIMAHAAMARTGPVTISTADHGNAVIKQVVNRYLANGWNARHVLDSRDGDYIELTP